MTTLDTIITRAYRESQIIDIDESPSEKQQAEALTLLQGIIARSYPPEPQIIVTLGKRPERARGQILRDFTNLAPDEPAPQNVVFHCFLTSAKKVLMPYAPSDGARLSFIDVGKNFASHNLTLDGNGATIVGGDTATLSTNGQRTEYFFRRDLADWREITTPGQFNVLPFLSPYFDDMFGIELALRINPRYGAEIPALTASLFKEMRSEFKARYSQAASSVAPDVLFGPGAGSAESIGDAGFAF